MALLKHILTRLFAIAPIHAKSDSLGVSVTVSSRVVETRQATAWEELEIQAQAARKAGDLVGSILL
jgi:hypothetical protein